MDVYVMLAAATVAFIATSGLMVALRPVAFQIELVDKPGGRKRHEGDIPIIGGIAMFAGIFAGLTVFAHTSFPLAPIFVACALLMCIGAIDDRFHIPSPARILTQVAAVLCMVYGADLSLASIGDPFGGGEIVMGRFTLIFTMLVTITMINAYNLIDGVDGLAGSLALVALLSVVAVAGFSHMVSLEALVVSAAIVGFLIFNFPMTWNRRVRSFMGDAGATLLGFTIVWITLGVSQGADRLISPVHCLWFASVPIYDTITCFISRAIKGKSPLAPGRDHFHHVLMRGDFGVRQTLGILTGIQLLFAIAGLTGHFAGVPDVAMFAAWSILGLSSHFMIRSIAKRHRAIRRNRLRA